MSTLKNKKRMFYVLLLVTLAWFGLITRLFIIQIKDTRDFSEYHIDLIANSVNQRKQEFVLSTGRGNIYDRNMQPLLEQRDITTVILFPFSSDFVNTDKAKSLAKILNISYESLISQLTSLESPTFAVKDGRPVELSYEQLQAINELQFPGVIATSYTLQEFNESSAKHVIGYLGQAPDIIEKEYKDYLEQGILEKDSLIGRSGLQMTFQEILIGVGESKIAYFVDNQGNPLNGLSTKYIMQDDSYYPLSLVTTIDKEIQHIVEEELDKYGIEDGSVVVLDAKNADILAMASAPDFNMLSVNPNNNDWNNRATQVIEPGSTFKTLITIAALEEGVVTLDETIYCDGEDELYHFTCHEEHGELTLEEAFAESCNIFFAELAKRLGPEKIEAYADSLGLVGEVGWSGEFFREDDFQQISNEEYNRVFHTDTNTNDPGSIMRTAIGQQDVRISPLAAANLIVTILNDGQVFEPRLVEKVIYKNDLDYYNFPIHKENSIGDKETYEILEDLMELVVDEGTGQLLNQAIWDLAGKTGTAETNFDLNHQWFIGYGPADNPKYAVAVAVKNVSTSEPLAKKVFMGVMDGLAHSF